MYISSSVCNVSVRFSFVINYVSEHQLSHVTDTFHTTPITCVNQGPKLLKLIGWRHYLCFRWVLYIPGTTTQMPGAELDCTARYYSNSKTKQYGMSVISGNPAVEPYLGCATCILGPPKILTLSPPSIFPIPV